MYRIHARSVPLVNVRKRSGVVVWNVRLVGCLYTEVVVTVVPLLQSRKEFALGAIYLLLKLQQGIVSYRDV